MDESYTKLDIPRLEKELQAAHVSAEKDAKEDYMKD